MTRQRFLLFFLIVIAAFTQSSTQAPILQKGIAKCADLSDAGAGCSGAAGSGAVSAGTQNQVAKYAANGTTVSGSSILSDDATNAYVDGPLDIKTNSLSTGYLDVGPIQTSGAPGTGGAYSAAFVQ